MNQHTPPPRCRLCLWFPDCLALRRPMLADCDAFCASGTSAIPRCASGDLEQTLDHDV